MGDHRTNLRLGFGVTYAETQGIYYKRVSQFAAHRVKCMQENDAFPGWNEPNLAPTDVRRQHYVPEFFLESFTGRDQNPRVVDLEKERECLQMIDGAKVRFAVRHLGFDPRPPKGLGFSSIDPEANATMGNGNQLIITGWHYTDGQIPMPSYRAHELF